MGPNSGQSNNSDKIKSFLESLRASRANSPKADRMESMGQNPFKEIQLKKEIEKRRVEQFHSARSQEWNRVYSAKEREKDSKIEQIRLQLKSLAAQLRVLDKNIAKVVDSPVQNAGAYDEGFFVHIQKVIKLFSQSVQSTNTLLMLHNERNGKKGYYWGMAKTQGNNFTQSNERTAATSVG
jgi:hypothetical protein